MQLRINNKMTTRLKFATALVLAIVSIGLIGCSADSQDSTSPPSTMPPSLFVNPPNLFTSPIGRNIAASGEDEVSSVEDTLDSGLGGARLSPAHLALTGTPTEGSERCEWRGVARTQRQREAAIRFWLGLDESSTLPLPEEAERLLLAELEDLNPVYPATVKANLRSLARGGLSHDYQFLTCYVDYTASEYILGAGQTALTVAYDRMSEERSYELYLLAHAAGEFGSQELFNRSKYQQYLEQVAIEVELALHLILQNHESLIFLAPMGAHNAIAVEAWQVVAQWHIIADNDGVKQAIRYGAGQSDPEHSQTLSSLKSRIVAATSPDSSDGSRITNISGLAQYYRDIGAYDDITPGDNKMEAFTPSQPPPSPTCANSTVITNHNSNRSLVRDCGTLLALKSALAGSTTLNWSADLSLSSWTGITTGGAPQRVTGLSLPSSSLSGSIPAGLERLSALATLDLSSNSLTGTIPVGLGNLSNLSTLRLSGNSLSGCIPPALRDVPTHDLASVGLSYCDMLTEPPAPSGLSLSEAEGTFTISWNEVSGATKYEPQDRIGDAADWTALGEVETASTTHTVDGGLACGTDYRFRVRAFGDGIMHSAEWGDPSSEAVHSTEVCNQDPAFGSDSYNFSVREDAEAGDTVGTALATDPDTDDGVTHGVTAGNDGGAFTLNSSTGEITVAAALDHETTPSYTLTVQAEDGNGGEDTATVNITITDVAEDLAPAPGGLGVSLSAGAFTLSWDPVSGASKYEAQHRVSETGDWAALPEAETTSTTYTPEGGPACGTTYQFRVRSFGDDVLYADEWGPESGAVTHETTACNQVPTFSSTSFDFALDETSKVGVAVGTAGATDGDEADTVAHSITAGNGEGKFTIAEDTGEIALAEALDYTTTTSYSLTVRAEDGNGGVATTTVNITVESVCRNGTVIVNPGNEPDLVGDCLVLYGAKGTLRGTAALDWDGNTALADWTGVNVEARRILGLELENMRLNGVVPASLGDIGRLRRLDLSGNQLTGTIPADLGSLSLLKYLDLRNNDLDSTIPTALGTLKILERLYLQGNDLTGTVPEELGNLTKLDRLRLEDNQLTGTIPPSLGNLRLMHDLRMQGNQLTGPIPAQLGNLSALKTLYLSDNRLDGEIPEELGRLSNLAVLGLELNLLSGEIPAELGDLVALRQLLLADNSLTGSIPEELGDMPALEELWLAGNQLSGSIPLSLARLQLTDLFLSQNSFTGCLPHGLRDVGSNDHQLDPAAVMTDCANEAPAFAESSYSFSVSEDAATGDGVGRVSAEDPDGRTVTYAITAGNEDGKFGIDTNGGAMTVTGELDYETDTSYTLTVRASDSEGETSEVSVSIGVTDVEE